MFSAVNTELAVKPRRLRGTQRLENKCTARLGAGHCLCSVAKLWQQGCAPPSLWENPVAGSVPVSSPSTCPAGRCAAPAGSALQDELLGSSGSQNAPGALRFMGGCRGCRFFLKQSRAPERLGFVAEAARMGGRSVMV